jgi:hypothetical protein
MSPVLQNAVTFWSVTRVAVTCCPLFHVKAVQNEMGFFLPTTRESGRGAPVQGIGAGHRPGRLSSWCRGREERVPGTGGTEKHPGKSGDYHAMAYDGARPWAAEIRSGHTAGEIPESSQAT